MNKLTVRKLRSKHPINVTANPQSFNAGEPAKSWEIWHRRYGHIGMSSLQQILEENLVEGFNVDTRTAKYDCEACTQAKQHQESFPKEINKEKTEPGQLTHTDLWGKYPIHSINRNQYFITFLDDGSRRAKLRFLKGKDEAAQAIKDYVTHLKVLGKNPRAFRFDRGKEFVNNNLINWFRQQGIEVQLTAPYSPSQNGAAERLNRTLVELARAMMAAQNLPEYLWEYAIEHAAYLRERAPTKALKGKTPHEAWFQQKPNVSHLWEFGTPVWILLQGQKVPAKMKPKSKQQLFVGFDDGSKSVKYYNAETRKVLTSRNYRFLTNLPPKELSPEPIIVHPSPIIPHEGESGSDMLQLGSQHNKRTREEANDEEVDELRRKTRNKAPVNYRYLDNPFPDEEDEEIYLSSAEIIYATFSETPLASEDPKTLREAINSPEWPEWEKAVKTELEQLERTGTWKLVECPSDAIPIGNKWVFIRKYNKMGELLKYKGRLVAKGCSQRPGFDFTDTFSPVVRLETIRAILSLVPRYKLKTQQMDVKGAYLNGTLKEKVYMKQPEGYDDGTGRVCLLIKTLYGLKQSGREWNKELDSQLKAKGFKNLRSDPCAYIRRNGNELEIITVWVDDLLLFTGDNRTMIKLKEELQSMFELTDMGEPSKIVGIEITQHEDRIIISQAKYIESILRKEGMENANPVSTPLDPNVKLESNPEAAEPNRSNTYASLIGSLQYLATATRPDIAYTVNRLASYTANPSLAHYSAAKRVLRYLKGTKNYGISYYANSTRNNAPEDSNFCYGYTDAAFANADDCKSTSGYVFLSNGGAITWGSKKQTVIALSSTEAEYVALSEASREAMWLRHLYGELGFIQKEPILILGDNDGSIAMAKNPQFHKRTKHVDIRWHFVRDLVQDGLINILDCRDPEQTADILTKQLPRPKHTKHVNELGLSFV